MRNHRLSCVGSLLAMILMLGTTTDATAAIQLEIPGATYTYHPAGDFTIGSVVPFGAFKYDLSDPAILLDTLSPAYFEFSTSGLSKVIDVAGNSVLYSGGTGGTFALRATPLGTTYLEGTLDFLSLVRDAGASSYDGQGAITATGGTLLSEFSSDGAGVASQIGLNFFGLVDFNSPMFGVVTTKLVGVDSAGTNPQIPEPTAFVTWFVLLGVAYGWGGKSLRNHKPAC